MANVPGLRLLVLHGSRARGDAHQGSDWDFAYRGAAGLDPDGLLARLADHLKADRIDLVDLARAGALIRFRVARDGVVIVEREGGAFDRFRLAAVDASPIDRPVLAERVAALERHLARVRDRLPVREADFQATSDASGAVVLHLWQATQIVIDLAVFTCVTLGAGTPGSCADAFRRLQAHGVIDEPMASRLVRAAGFRNVVAHAYENLDMRRVYRAAVEGPAGLRAFVGALSRVAE